MTGYHYTTYRNWKKIQRNGLKPQIVKNNLYPVTRTVEGIWVWENKQSPKSHLGNLIRLVAKHEATKGCLLAVTYKDEDVLEGLQDGQQVRLIHHGNIDRWIYHRNQTARILINPIPPDRIKLLGIYDLIKLTNYNTLI